MGYDCDINFLFTSPRHSLVPRVSGRKPPAPLCTGDTMYPAAPFEFLPTVPQSRRVSTQALLKTMHMCKWAWLQACSVDGTDQAP